MLAVAMFLQSRTGAAIAHPHLEGQAHSHSHWNLFARTPAVLSVSGETQVPVPLRRLLALGVTGGMIPCPAALVVLLSAVALHRVAEGLLLIVAFSAGLAAVLIAIGLVMVHAGRIVSKWTPSSAILSWLPACSSTLIFLLGCGLVLQAAGALGFTMHWPEEMKAPALLYAVGLGLVLGMRHSTDADHVVAVTTIVSRQRSIGSAAAIGALWGVGHTFTIFLVGSAIILFNVVIPARVGLAMEFAVALMLVLLGVLNLSGVISRLSRRFSAVRVSAQASPAGEDGEFSRVPWLRGLGRYQLLRPLVIGTVHGLAGSAAVALLVLTTIRTPAWAVAYLCVFGFGTVLGMMFMTAAMALPFAFAKNGFARMNSYVGVTSGVVSFAFGLFLVYQIGFVDGLFTSAPRWSPH
jgi:high-affinity nickel-transport protein